MVIYIDYIYNFVIRILIDWKFGQILIIVIDQLFKVNKRVISIIRLKGVVFKFIFFEFYFFILFGEEYLLFMNENKLDVISLYEL